MPDSGRRLSPAAAIAVACSGLLATSAFAAHIVGTPGNDRIRGTAKADVIQAREGDDRVFARRGSDQVDLGPGADRAFGDRGDDSIFGGAPGPRTGSGATAGDDTLRGDLDDVGDLVSQDVLHGGRGDDKLYGGDGRDRLFGWLGNDLLEGGRGADRLLAGPGNDTVNGQEFNDFQSGGFGDDVQDGGARRRHDLRQQGPRHDRGRRRQRPAVRAVAQRDVTGPGRRGRATPSAAAPATTGSPSATARRTSSTAAPASTRRLLDFKDVVEDGSCEVVSRRAPNRADSRVEDRNEGEQP